MTFRLYVTSKEIIPGGDCHDFRYLNLVRERENSSLRFKIFLSKTERPAILEVGDVVFHPEDFKSERDARRLYFSINSFHDFIASKEAKDRKL